MRIARKLQEMKLPKSSSSFLVKQTPRIQNFTNFIIIQLYIISIHHWQNPKSKAFNSRFRTCWSAPSSLVPSSQISWVGWDAPTISNATSVFHRESQFSNQAIASQKMIPKPNFRIQNNTFNRNFFLRINKTKNSPNIFADASEIDQNRHLPKKSTISVKISPFPSFSKKKREFRGTNLDPCLARLAQRWPTHHLNKCLFWPQNVPRKVSEVNFFCLEFTISRPIWC